MGHTTVSMFTVGKMIKAAALIFSVIKVIERINTYILTKHFWRSFANYIITAKDTRSSSFSSLTSSKSSTSKKMVANKIKKLQKMFSYENFYANFQKINKINSQLSNLKQFEIE